MLGPASPEVRPNQEPTSKEDQTASIPIPGTPFRLTAEGRLLVAVDLQELLTNQGIPGQLAQRLVAQKDPEAVAKVLLNALYLQSQGKLQNGPGYIGRASRMDMTSCRRSPAGSKTAVASSRISCGSWKPGSSSRVKWMNKPPNKPPWPT